MVINYWLGRPVDERLNEKEQVQKRIEIIKVEIRVNIDLKITWSAVKESK